MIDDLARAAAPLVLLTQSGTDAGEFLASVDWREALLGVYPLTLWLIRECYELRKENARINQESRDTAKTAIEALVRMASERRGAS